MESLDTSADFHKVIFPLLTEPQFNTGVPVDTTNPTAREMVTAIERSGGKIPYSEFMQIALYGNNGYYSQARVGIGHGKDFITTPEYSQLTGATFGLAAKRVWESMNRPTLFRIIEMGAGSEALAEGLLSWMEKLDPDFYQAIRYTIVEYGDLINEQRTKLSRFHNVDWIRGSAYQLPLGNNRVEGVLISNELPDAFPVERVAIIPKKKSSEEYRLVQKYIGIADRRWVEYWDEPQPDVSKYLADNRIAIQELHEYAVNLLANSYCQETARVLGRGTIITVDYGHAAPREHLADSVSFATVYYSNNTRYLANQMDQIYRNLGKIDITSMVDFSVLIRVSQEAKLNPQYLGVQDEFSLLNGLNDLLRAAEATLHSTQIWPEIVSLSQAIRGQREMRDRDFFKKFLVLVSSRDLPQLWIETNIPEEYLPTPLTIVLQTYLPNQKLELQTPPDEKTVMATTNSDGAIGLSPEVIRPGVAIINPRDGFGNLYGLFGRNKVWGLKTTRDVEKLIRELGKTP